jgi:hypothetical protein
MSHLKVDGDPCWLQLYMQLLKLDLTFQQENETLVPLGLGSSDRSPMGAVNH